MPIGLKILLSIIGGIALVLLILRLLGKHHQPYAGTDPVLSSWMGRISDDTPINRIIVPGSHDAGTVGVVWAAETQSYTIKEQLLSGIRYFDLRVHKRGDNDYVMFHSIADGMSFLTVLEWIRDFIKENPTELLYLDFQHFKGDSQKDVCDLLQKYLGEDGLLLNNDTELSDLQFIRSLKLKDVRGKCIVFWGDKSIAKESFLFPRNTDRCTEDQMCLDSYYIAPLHKKTTEVLVGEAHPQYFGRMQKLKAKGEDGIFVLQCQLTDGIVVRGPWARDKQNNAKMNEYVRCLKNSDVLLNLNIIMRDFVTPKKAADIINLNANTSNMKEAINLNIVKQ